MDRFEENTSTTHLEEDEKNALPDAAARSS
jgi:hypothetical protein